MSIDRHFQEYFGALDRAGNEDRCFLCRRSPAEVKQFFGFHEDGTPLEAEEHGLEDVVLTSFDIMSYRGTRPVCAVCQLNLDTIFLADNGHATLRRVLHEMEHDRERLWSEPAVDADGPDPSADPSGGSSADPGGDPSGDPSADGGEPGRDEPA